MSASTKTLRAFFIENPKMVPAGDKSVGPKSANRGRVSQEAIAVFSEATGEAHDYIGKPTVALTYKHEQPSGRKVTKTVQLLPSEVRALVKGAPERGRLSNAHLEAAAEAYAAKVVAARG